MGKLLAVLSLIGAAVFVSFRNLANPYGVKYPEANVTAPIENVDQQIQAATAEVAIDIQTGQRLTSFAETGVGIAAGALAAATTGTGALSGTLLFSATGWTIVGGIVAGLLVAFNALRSQTHLFANAIVDQFENPFSRALSQIVDAKDAAVADGSFTVNELKQTYNSVQVLWYQYRAALLKLMEKGGDWVIVAKQSLNNLNNEYEGETLSNGKKLGKGLGGLFPDGFINAILAKIDTQIDSAAQVAA